MPKALLVSSRAMSSPVFGRVSTEVADACVCGDDARCLVSFDVHT